ncbi:hypothetical protein K9U37_07775 [Mycolicibacterium litorale]|uniref:Uncharacterized protein n=1 Tax=Candidatus Mycolicibacterium alkanivorans TaxID=2954114 RepID=A0ABS9YUI2_9MYCO|nr:hypothetical protein [Candidatus Mycolicibacterium alkanivorans]MCI4674807.1 hypothetical protein [Candidatus Mycolicibacterium alkanivorans]
MATHRGQLSTSTRMVSRLSPMARTAALFIRGNAASPGYEYHPAGE